jgi:transposase
MPGMVVGIERRVKFKLRKLRRETRDKGLYRRCQVVLLAAKGRARALIAEAVGYSVSWVDRVLRRFRDQGVVGLVDHREDNGQSKLDDAFLRKLYEVVDGSPQDHGYPRPTWTQELLCLVMERQTGVKVHRATMSRALGRIGARLGRPKPMVGCPWPRRRRQQRLAEIEQVVQSLHRQEVAVYADEVDIHLNPKVGADWMNRGKQKRVMTPGQNVKHYLAGALDVGTGEIIWVDSNHKNSLLVIALLKELVGRYPQARKIHVILDNFKIHDSQATRAAVSALEGRIVLHFLPPYCPDHNRIERTWKDLHDNVTRNHRCPTMEQLMREVTGYIRRRNRAIAGQWRKAAA